MGQAMLTTPKYAPASLRALGVHGDNEVVDSVALS